MSLAVVCLTFSGLSTVLGAIAVGAAPTAPYTDPDAVGYIGLCNQASQQITSGSVSAAPFVWRAVSSQPAPTPYNGPGGTAILDAYLPMQALAPGDWSGEQLTSSTRYSNPESPMAQATDRDVPLEEFLQDYPPQWDGFIQLRLFLGAQNQPADVQHYPALNLQISGDTWTTVGGGPVNCNAGNAESLETVLAPTSTTTTVATSGVVSNRSSTNTSPSGASSTKRPTASAASVSGDAKPADSNGLATAQPQSWRHSDALYLGVVVLILVLLSALMVSRRRRARRLSSTASQASVKGPQP